MYTIYMQYVYRRVSFIMVCVLVLIGTCYDIILRYKTLRGTDEECSGDNTVTLSALRSNGKVNHKVTILELWTIKTHNGSLGNVSSPVVYIFILLSSLTMSIKNVNNINKTYSCVSQTLRKNSSSD